MSYLLFPEGRKWLGMQFICDWIPKPVYSDVRTYDTYEDLPHNELQSAIDDFNDQLDWPDMWTLKVAKTRLDLGGVALLLAFRESKVIGWLWCDLMTGSSTSMWVNKECAHQKVGYDISTYSLNLFKDRKIEMMMCAVEMWNIKAMEIFIKNGMWMINGGDLNTNFNATNPIDGTVWTDELIRIRTNVENLLCPPNSTLPKENNDII